LPADSIDAHCESLRGQITEIIKANPINARITLSGYEGSELLVARLLVECGADLRYVGTACAASKWSADDRAWLEERGVEVCFRASLEQDVAAVDHYQPDLAIGTTPVVQHAKEQRIPGLYFTNLISARPLMGPAGAASLAGIVNSAVSNRQRFETMEAFFGETGREDRAGIWTPDTVNRAGLAGEGKASC
jgi:chlorophyllide a reductase subunit Y